MANKIVHAEVVGKDGPKLHRFYGQLFDWKQNTDLPGGYGMTDAADSGIVEMKPSAIRAARSSAFGPNADM